MTLPWAFKLIYGLIADNVVLFGSRKKVFIIMGSLIQFLCLQALCWIPFENPAPVAYLMMIINMSLAFMDLVVDSIMVVQQRRDLKNGAEVLRSYASSFQMTGILLGSCVGGYMNQYYHPKWTFLLYSAIGASVAVSGCTLSSEIDKEGIENCGSLY
jgi:predicted MFS family arabinose efflux permease